VLSACLVDVYETLVQCDLTSRRARLARLAGVDAGTLNREFERFQTEIDRGQISLAGLIAGIFTSAGQDAGPERIGPLVEAYRASHFHDAKLFEDALPFLAELRSRGIPIALVSNCGESTRPVLEALGLFDEVDVAVLSCEVGHAKPSAEIFHCALTRLGVSAQDAIMIDDQARCCAGAVAAGLTAMQIVRGEPGSGPAEPGVRVIRSLMEALA